MNKELEMTPNVLVEFLQKPASEFTKEDIIRYIYEKDIQMVNFMYPAGDGRLKTLNFVINNAAYLDAILTCGERVDGSSLFSFIEAGSSDLYVVPRFRTAFEDPFAELPTLTMLCSFFNKDGEPLESSPEYTLHKACKAFHEVTGMDFEAMGELEYYVIAPDEGKPLCNFLVIELRPENPWHIQQFHLVADFHPLLGTGDTRTVFHFCLFGLCHAIDE